MPKLQLKKIWKDWVQPLAIAVVINLLIQGYVAQAVKVPTPSMVPTIQVNDRLIVEKIERVDDYKFGEIIVFWPPVQQGPDKERYVKRLIGLPGDTIEVKDSTLYRNGTKIPETYLSEQMTYQFGPVKVPEGKLFVLGDNRNVSYDSHLWPEPFVDEEEVIGRVIFRIYPFDRIGGM